MKVILRKVVIGIGILILGFWAYLSITKPFWKDTDILNCGTVESVLTAERPAKYHLVNELYLGVRWDKGNFEAVNVSPTTFMQKKVGDKVCFTSHDRSYDKYMMSSGIFFIAVGFSILGLLIQGLIRLFDNED